MNLKNIQAIISSGFDNWEDLLLSEISKDEDIIPNMMRILEHERVNKKALLTDTNAELSRALVTIMDENYGTKEGKQKAYIDRLWVVEQIKNHYLKWKETIRCCFKIEGLP